MPGPEYRRARMLQAAELLRKVKLAGPRHLAVSHWLEQRQHVIEVQNLETGVSARLTALSPLDIPTYGEIVETLLLRCRV
jgi:hypothetical protein